VADIYEDDTNRTMLSSNGNAGTVPSSSVPAEYTMLCASMVKAPFRLASGGLVPATRSLAGDSLYAGSSGPVVPPVFGAYW
jgi:hypothetical protein